MRTHNILHDKENRKDIPIFPPDLALLLTLISLNYPCLKHVFMVPKVFQPLKLDCSSKFATRRRTRLVCNITYKKALLVS